jgi:hypothetical protein
MTSQSSINGILASMGAAGGVGGFIVLVRPQYKKAAVAIAILVFLIGVGAVAFFEGAFTGGERPEGAS